MSRDVLSADELDMGERMMERLHRPTWMAPSDAQMQEWTKTLSDEQITSSLESCRESLRDELAHYLRLLRELRRRGK